jgi:hypothetical protein
MPIPTAQKPSFSEAPLSPSRLPRPELCAFLLLR